MKLGVFLLCLGLSITVRAFIILIKAIQKINANPWLLASSDLSVQIVVAGIILIISSIPIYFGIRRIHRARREQEPVEKQIERKRKEFIAFIKENCLGCKFADSAAVKKALDEKSGEALLPLSSVIPSVKKEWCLRSEPPECDSQYCYSREVNRG